MKRAGHLLRSVLSSFRKPPREHRRDHPTSRPTMDGANCSKRDAGHLGLPSSMPLCSARSRHEVLCFVSVGTGVGRRQSDPLPAKSPNLNAFAERWVRSVKQECLSKLILFGEGTLSRALGEYNRHYHHERNHQGKDNKILFPTRSPRGRSIECSQRLGGLLNYYRRAA